VAETLIEWIIQPASSPV